MNGYSYEINEYERLTVEDDDKNEFVYNVRAMVGGEQKCDKMTKYEVTIKNNYEIMKISCLCLSLYSWMGCSCFVVIG